MGIFNSLPASADGIVRVAIRPSPGALSIVFSANTRILTIRAVQCKLLAALHDRVPRPRLRRQEEVRQCAHHVLRRVAQDVWRGLRAIARRFKAALHELDGVHPREVRRGHALGTQTRNIYRGLRGGSKARRRERLPAPRGGLRADLIVRHGAGAGALREFVREPRAGVRGVPRARVCGIVRCGPARAWRRNAEGCRVGKRVEAARGILNMWRDVRDDERAGRTSGFGVRDWLCASTVSIQ